MTPNAAACLTALRACASARRIDPMARTGLTREAVARAVQELLEARLARSINGGARYAARPSICPPDIAATSTTQLADDTHGRNPHPRGGELGAVADTGHQP